MVDRDEVTSGVLLPIEGIGIPYLRRIILAGIYRKAIFHWQIRELYRNRTGESFKGKEDHV